MGTIVRFLVDRSRCPNVIFNPRASEWNEVSILRKYDGFFSFIPHDQAKIRKKKRLTVANSRRLLGFRDGKGEFTSHAYFTFDMNLPTVFLYKLLAEDQSQACSLFVCCSAGCVRGGFVEKDF